MRNFKVSGYNNLLLKKRCNIRIKNGQANGYGYWYSGDGLLIKQCRYKNGDLIEEKTVIHNRVKRM